MTVYILAAFASFSISTEHKGMGFLSLLKRRDTFMTLKFCETSSDFMSSSFMDVGMFRIMTLMFCLLGFWKVW